MAESGESGKTASEFVSESPREIACPHCGEVVAVAPGPVAQVLTCPHCTKELLVPAVDGSIEIVDAEESPDTEPDTADVPQDQLNALRIRQLAAGRRATYRARSSCVIAAGVCLVTAVQLVWVIVKHSCVRGWDLQCSGYALFTVLAVFGCGYFMSQARGFARETRQTALGERTAPPDFSTLQDGSQRVKNLEQIR